MIANNKAWRYRWNVHRRPHFNVSLEHIGLFREGQDEFDRA